MKAVRRCIVCDTRWASTRTGHCRRCLRQLGLVPEYRRLREAQMVRQAERRAAFMAARRFVPPPPPRVMRERVVDGQVYEVVWDGAVR